MSTNYLEEYLANGGRDELAKYARKLTRGNYDLADDLVQDTLTWASWSTAFDPEKGDFRTWVGMFLWNKWKQSFKGGQYNDATGTRRMSDKCLGSLTLHHIHNHAGEAASVCAVDDDDEGYFSELGLASVNDERNHIQRQDVAWALAQLTPKERALVTWHDIEGLTCEEVSDRYRAVFQKPMTRHRQYVVKLLKPIRAKLRALLASYADEYGYTDAPRQSGSTLTEIPLAA